MKLWIQTIGLIRGDVVKTMSWEETNDLKPCHFGNAKIKVEGDKAVLTIEKTESCEIFLEESVRIPRTVFNGKTVTEPVTQELKIGDVLVVYSESNVAYLVFKETVMVIENPV